MVAHIKAVYKTTINETVELPKNCRVTMLKDMAFTLRPTESFSSVKEALKSGKLEKYTEIVFNYRDSNRTTQYRCLFSDQNKAKKYHSLLKKRYDKDSTEIMKERYKTYFEKEKAEETEK